ncbi:restriction endonuclease subunit S [Streptococcus thermophilus]|uniref:restriction endonuclease subunit S n=1 Tax=Streptococcus thermophilus TaxID=1308 RepID=UPI0015C1E4D1|nr:restriction endonuclease subunit S [Streptococcus thermophilus]MBZ5770070.1 restriction endonuclease subunit S [Streptococcus thermophilus]MBZ5813595.1 restriction endonuclease subunit S [Streptococcus thermophilus]MCE2166519.1 restriction endonuclease subunit S [Streptococcus thermophilus]MCE2213776.1 restriction endonuclease subunit S [Streptococcus thermophilus]MCE2215414.1 restriction endonuclease subunit S [Streptococcus thermophilus]
MSELSNVSCYVTEKISVDNIDISEYITTDNLLQNKRGRVLAEKLPTQKVTKFKKDDILIANIRPYLKKIWQADIEGGASSDVLVIRPNDLVDNNFLYYALTQDSFFEYVMKGSKGTKMPRGDKSQIMNFVIPDLDIDEQIKIGKLLKSIDQKIQINNKINQELESMAKTLYDYWFVQFDFPDQNGKPYRSSGGKMVYNPELKREIPEGWGVEKLGNIANITMGQSPKGTSYNEVGEGMLFFQGSTDFGWRFPVARQYTTEPSRIAEEDDILLSVRAPVGTLNIADTRCCIGRGLAAINSKVGANSYIFNVMQDFKKLFDMMNSVGTTFGSITKDDLYSLQLVYPPNELLMKFDKSVNSFDREIKNRSRQNQELSQLRDWLLPMLMNGQVKVE